MVGFIVKRMMFFLVVSFSHAVDQPKELFPSDFTSIEVGIDKLPEKKDGPLSFSKKNLQHILRGKFTGNHLVIKSLGDNKFSYKFFKNGKVLGEQKISISEVSKLLSPFKEIYPEAINESSDARWNPKGKVIRARFSYKTPKGESTNSVVIADSHSPIAHQHALNALQNLLDAFVKSTKSQRRE